MTGRARLMRELWPDKVLFGSILLLVTGLLGMLYGALDAVADLAYSENVPMFIRDYPPWLMAMLSAAAAGLAYLALRERNTTWALMGSVAGILSVGPLALGTLLSLLALAFTLRAREEREDLRKETLALTDDMWPDKALAASMLSLVNGCFTLAWGLGLTTGAIRIGFSFAPTLGLAAVAVGALLLVAAALLYRQKAPWLGFVAALGGIATFGMYLIGPLLGLATLAMLAQAWREDEFEPQPAPQARAAGQGLGPR